MTTLQKVKWIGGLAEWIEGDTAFLSVAFTWKLPEAYERARWYAASGYAVKAGGPAFFVRKDYLKGVAETGDDYPDAVWRHNPNATIASRGCPVGCWFCIVPSMEGEKFTLLPDFPVRPILCDNNLSALEPKYQDHIVSRYVSTGIPLMDANSGFEPRTFHEDVYRRWKTINRGPWRFAYDDMQEREQVKAVMKMLKEEVPSKKRVYCLIGNEPMEACLQRINEIIGWGGEPHVQPYMKLNALERIPHARFDWTVGKLKDMARWANRFIWRSVPDFNDYKGSVRTGDEVYNEQEGLFV